jgi:hypothetical protein
MSSFSLSAAPGTDVWKKHPKWDVYNGQFPGITPFVPPP